MPPPPPPTTAAAVETVVTPVFGGRLMLDRVVNDTDCVGIINQLRELVFSSNAHGAGVRFPGSNPCSIERNDFQHLSRAPYWALEKTDGARFCMMCCRYKDLKLCVLLDRALAIYLLPLKALPRAVFQGTLFDGELVMDKQNNNAWTFLIFDAVCASACPLYHHNYSHRLGIAQRVLAHYVESPGDRVRVCVKRIVPVRDTVAVHQLLESARQHFDVDGLILQPEIGGVVFGRHRKLYKWKEHHTVDFIYHTQGHALNVYDPERRQLVKVATLLVAKLKRGCMPPHGAVVECVQQGQDTWELITVRKDKGQKGANDLLTYRKTMTNEAEAITLHELLAAAAAGAHC